MAWTRTTIATGILTFALIMPQISGGQERPGAVMDRRDPVVSAAAHVQDMYGRDSHVRNAMARSVPAQQADRDDTLVEPIPRPETTLEEASSNLLDSAIPPGFEPWWRARVLRSLRPSPEIYPLDLDALVISALAYSPRVRAISENVLIQETVVVEERAAFDPRSFAESRFFRRSQPIGNLLETGGPPRWREEDWGLSGGLRKRTPMGGSWEIAQRIGTQASNSKFFIPEQQGNAKMALSFNQPLLNGFGKVYNTSLIVLAELDTQAAADETSAALQQQLTTIADTYWELYLQRAVLVQKHEHLARAMSVLQELERRREIDALESQIVRAQAAVAARQSELVRAAANVQNIEARLRALTSAPDLMAHAQAELIPLNQPGSTRVDVELQDALVTALQHRPEIDAAAQAVRAAGVRLNMSRNELLPALDLVLETYVMGLDADYDVGAAFANQYAEGEPSYAAGFVFEVPLHRRAAKAQFQRRSLQLRQVTEQFDATVQMLLADVEVAVRDVQAAYQEMSAKYRAMRAATAEVEYSTRRWQLLAGEDRSAGLLLEDLLDAQDRLVVEEFGFALAQHSYAVSQTALKQAMGTLLEQEGIDSYRTCQGGIPQLQFQKNDGFATPVETLPAGQSRFGEQTDLRATLR